MLLSQTFERLQRQNEKGLVLFVTAGDPSLGDLPAILSTLTEAGADVVEVGLPFSDPIADGPVISAASQRALLAGTTTKSVLACLRDCPREAPLVVMGYYNPILRYGLGTFAEQASSAGVSGAIICDLTPEESGDWESNAKKFGLATIFLCAPTSTKARLQEVASKSTGFVYAISRTGVTGAKEQSLSEGKLLVENLKRLTSTPVCLGFGISTPSHVREASSFADGVIVGSWLVDALARSWDRGRGRQKIFDEVAQLKEATRS